MVEAKPENEDNNELSIVPLDEDMANLKRMMNDPRFLDSAEAEIERMLMNAKIALTDLGLDLDKERMENPVEEEKFEEDDTELERLLAGGLPFCREEKACGHRCEGVLDEERCFPCLQPECIPQGSILPERSELCNICYTCELNEEPSVELGCGHVFHANCVMELLKHRWASLRITFAFMNCPQCKQPIEADHVHQIADEIEKHMVLRSELQVKSMKIVKKEGLDKDPRVTTPGDFYYGKLMLFAENKVCYYMCSKCAVPYFGGVIDCEQEMGMEDTTRREDLICRPCLMREMSFGSNICRNGHGAEFIDWKCMYCCSVALFSCGGKFFFCDRCHIADIKKIRDCKGKNCPLNTPHPPAGRDIKKSGFPLGCSICRSEHLEEYDAAQAMIKKMVTEEGAQAFQKLGIAHNLHGDIKLKSGKGYGKKAKAHPFLKKRKEPAGGVIRAAAAAKPVAAKPKAKDAAAQAKK